MRGVGKAVGKPTSLPPLAGKIGFYGHIASAACTSAFAPLVLEDMQAVGTRWNVDNILGPSERIGTLMQCISGRNIGTDIIVHERVAEHNNVFLIRGHYNNIYSINTVEIEIRRGQSRVIACRISVAMYNALIRASIVIS